MPAIETSGPEQGRAELSARQERFALAVASGTTKRAAAEAAGVSERTGARWAGTEPVKARVRELVGEIKDKAVERIAEAVAAKAGALRCRRFSRDPDGL